MIRSGDHVQAALHTGSLQCLVKIDTLLQRHKGIVVSVHDKKRRGVLLNKIKRAGETRRIRMIMNGAAEQFVNRRGGSIPSRGACSVEVAPMQEIAWPKPVEDTLHPARFIEVSAHIELACMSGNAKQRRQMASG